MTTQATTGWAIMNPVTREFQDKYGRMRGIETARLWESQAECLVYAKVFGGCVWVVRIEGGVLAAATK